MLSTGRGHRAVRRAPTLQWLQAGAVIEPDARAVRPARSLCAVADCYITAHPPFPHQADERVLLLSVGGGSSSVAGPGAAGAGAGAAGGGAAGFGGPQQPSPILREFWW